jgi:hypothetical protein
LLQAFRRSPVINSSLKGDGNFLGSPQCNFHPGSLTCLG